MHLNLLNDVVGVTSFWNLAAPAIALAVLAVGFVVWGTAKQPGAARSGVAVIAVGLLALAGAAGVDVARNVHDAGELESAAHARYGLTLGYADAAALFDSSDVTRAEVGGRAVTEYGGTTIAVGSRTVTVFLDRLADGSFLLATDDGELPTA